MKMFIAIRWYFGEDMKLIRRYNHDLMVMRIYIQFERILDVEGRFIDDGTEGVEMRLNRVTYI